MIDWTQSMQQTFEYYIVDPATWKDVKKLDCIISSSITRDSEAETLGSASFDMIETPESKDLGEVYVRVYASIVQNGVKQPLVPLGTYLVQTPSYTFNGHYKSYSIDAYTPLLELKEKKPPLGYAAGVDTNIMSAVSVIAGSNMRAPVVVTESTSSDPVQILRDAFVAETDESWLTYLQALASRDSYLFKLTPNGSLIFEKKKKADTSTPIWTYDDGNASILLPTATYERDLYGIPNVVEVVWSNSGDYYTARAVNDDPTSPISTVNRGREIIERVINPEDLGNPTQDMIERYANDLLESYSTIECTVSYSHGYCPVDIGDCVRINYERAGLVDVKAIVTSQSISCTPGMEVSETATYSIKLWEPKEED